VPDYYPICSYSGEHRLVPLDHSLYGELYRTSQFDAFVFKVSSHNKIYRYLQNGNILAARAFIKQFISALPPSVRVESSSPIAVGSESEVVITKDPLVNFAQLAVLTCQRAQGEKNKVMRESWVRLCGTYQSRGGILTQPEARKVSYRIIVATSLLII